jgi:hypothetical protein
MSNNRNNARMRKTDQAFDLLVERLREVIGNVFATIERLHCDHVVRRWIPSSTASAPRIADDGADGVDVGSGRAGTFDEARRGAALVRGGGSRDDGTSAGGTDFEKVKI